MVTVKASFDISDDHLWLLIILLEHQLELITGQLDTLLSLQEMMYLTSVRSSTVPGVVV